MALDLRRQRSRCRRSLSEFNVSAATRPAISGAGTRNAALYPIHAVGAHDQVLLGRWSGLMPSHQLQGRLAYLKCAQDAGALVGCMQ